MITRMGGFSGRVHPGRSARRNRGRPFQVGVVFEDLPGAHTGYRQNKPTTTRSGPAQVASPPGDGLETGTGMKEVTKRTFSSVWES